MLCSILSFVFWIFPPLDTAVQLESADSKQNTISKSLFQDSFWHIFWAMRKIHHTFWKKATFTCIKSSPLPPPPPVEGPPTPCIFLACHKNTTLEKGSKFLNSLSISKTHTLLNFHFDSFANPTDHTHCENEFGSNLTSNKFRCSPGRNRATPFCYQGLFANYVFTRGGG